MTIVSAPRPPRLRGLRLAVADESAAVALLARVFAAPVERRGGARWPRLQLAGPWIEVRGTPGDTLDLQCDDLAQQRTHLQRLGIETLDGAALGCTPCLRLDTLDTGACRVDLHEAPLQAQAQRDGDAPALPTARLCSIELAVRSPQRVALHWAQLFHARSLRDAQGQPALAFEGLELRFALAPDGHPGVKGLEFSVEDVGAFVSDASSRGVELQRHDALRAEFRAQGVRFSVRTAGPF